MSVEQGWPGLAQYIPAVPADWSPIPRTVQDALDELGGRSPGTSGETSFVYRPGGGSSPGVYVTAAALLAAVDSSDTAQNKVISVDASLVGGTAVINNGPWPDNITWQSGKGSVLAVLELDEGTTFAGLTYRFRNILVAPHNTAIIWTIGAGTSANLVLDQGAALAPSGAGHVFADVAGTLSISLFESVVGDGTAGHELFEVEATGAMLVFAFDASAFNANASKQGAAPGGTLGITLDGASQSTISVTQVPVPTTLNVDPQPTFVWAPGASTIPGANVFTSWTAMMAAAALSPGSKTLVLDSSGPGFASFTVDAGTWDLNEFTIFASQIQTNAQRTLVFPDNAFINPNLRTLYVGLQVLLTSTNTVGPVCLLPAAATGICQMEFLGGGGLTASGATAKPFFQVPNAAALTIRGVGNVQITVQAGAASVIQTDVGGNTFVRFTGGIGGGSASLVTNSVSGGGTTTVHASAESLINTTQVGVTGTFTFTWDPVINTTQATGNTGTGTGTVTVVTGNIARLKSGKMKVNANIVGEATGAGAVVTATLLRDATPIGNTMALTVLSANDIFSIPFTFIDTAPDLAVHTYTLSVAASAGNLTVAANSAQIVVEEL